MAAMFTPSFWKADGDFAVKRPSLTQACGVAGACQGEQIAQPVDRLARGRIRLSGALLSLGAGRAWQDPDGLGVGRLRPRATARTAPLRRGACRQGGARSLGRGG